MTLIVNREGGHSIMYEVRPQSHLDMRYAPQLQTWAVIQEDLRQLLMKPGKPWSGILHIRKSMVSNIETNDFLISYLRNQ